MLKRSMLSLAIAVGVMTSVALQTSTAKALHANEVSYWIDFAQTLYDQYKSHKHGHKKGKHGQGPVIVIDPQGPVYTCDPNYQIC
jgi:hypothetical protein